MLAHAPDDVAAFELSLPVRQVVYTLTFANALFKFFLRLVEWLEVLKRRVDDLTGLRHHCWISGRRFIERALMFVLLALFTSVCLATYVTRSKASRLGHALLSRFLLISLLNLIVCVRERSVDGCVAFVESTTTSFRRLLNVVIVFLVALNLNSE